MEALVVDSTKIRDRFLVHVGIRRHETIYNAHIVAEMELVIGTAGLSGELLAWWGSRSKQQTVLFIGKSDEAQYMECIPMVRLKYNESLDN